MNRHIVMALAMLTLSLVVVFVLKVYFDASMQQSVPDHFNPEQGLYPDRRPTNGVFEAK